MKHLISVFVFAIALNFVGNAQAQQPISEEKKNIISKIIKVTKADVDGLKMYKSIVNAMENSFSPIASSVIDGDESLTIREKEAIEKTIHDIHQSFSKRFHARISKEINFDEYIQATMTSIYDKFFTVDELKGLLAFYKTPAGKKLVEVGTDMAVESIKKVQEMLMPKIQKIIDDIRKEDLEKSKKPGSRTKKNQVVEN